MAVNTPSPTELREAIAEALWTHVNAHDLPRVCDGFKMPQAPADVQAFTSKRRYVRQRLIGMRAAELIDMARAVAEDYDDRDLLTLVSPSEIRGVKGDLKNLIFAANGPKPRIVLRDAINNVIEIVEHADACLVYDRPLQTGLSWGELVQWWKETSSVEGDPARTLFTRLRLSVGSPVEHVLFNAYGSFYGLVGGDQLPALIPQVYLHYDPYTVKELRGRDGQALARQRMDFLILFPDRTRAVIEVDGKQHYAEGDYASPGRYAEMVAEDRRLRLAGYEVYRFGGAELQPDDPQAGDRVQQFFSELFDRHHV